MKPESECRMMAPTRGGGGDGGERKKYPPRRVLFALGGR